MANFGGFKQFGRVLGFLAALVVVLSVAGFYLRKKLNPPQPAAVGERAPAPAPETKTPPGAKEEPGKGQESPEASLESQTVELTARPALTLKGEAPLDGAQTAITEALGKLNAAAAKAGVKPSGKPIAVFSETSEKAIRFEAMLPLEKAPEGKGKLDGGVDIGATPAGKALKFEHRGPYEDIESTYEAITAFLDEKGLDTKDRFIEEYISDLADGEDEEGEVDIYIFVK
jgi:effector-binding domain-containing protein